MELVRLLIGTIQLRPYVFIFFAIYLVIAVTTIGLKRTAIFTVLAYAIAFVSEYSSSHGDSGIPFGVYRYIQSTRDRELWIARSEERRVGKEGRSRRWRCCSEKTRR